MSVRMTGIVPGACLFQPVVDVPPLEHLPEIRRHTVENHSRFGVGVDMLVSRARDCGGSIENLANKQH